MKQGRKARVTDAEAFQAGVQAALAGVELTRAAAADVLGYESPTRFCSRNSLWLAYIEGYRQVHRDAELPQVGNRYTHLTPEFAYQAGQAAAQSGAQMSRNAALPLLRVKNSKVLYSRPKIWEAYKKGFRSICPEAQQPRQKPDFTRQHFIAATERLAAAGTPFMLKTLAAEIGCSDTTTSRRKEWSDECREIHRKLMKPGSEPSAPPALTRCGSCTTLVAESLLQRVGQSRLLCPDCQDEYRRFAALDDQWRSA